MSGLPEVVRERDVQPSDQAAPLGPQFGPELALEVLVDHLAYRPPSSSSLRGG